MLLQVANPPLVGVLGGVLVGATPLGRLLYRPDSAAAVAQTLRLPIELRVCLGKSHIYPVVPLSVHLSTSKYLACWSAIICQEVPKCATAPGQQHMIL